MREIIYRKLTEIKKLPNNPRTIKKADMEKLKKSLQDNKDYFEARPIILSNRTGELVILAGNQRYEAAKAIGMEEVPTILLEGLTEEREKEIIIRDNVSNGDWDWDELANAWDSDVLDSWGVMLPFQKETEKDDVEIYFALKIEIDCDTEEEQRELFEKLTREGIKCRIL